MAENVTTIMQVIPKQVDFIEWMIPVLDKFPRNRRFLLGDRIETGLFSVLDKLIEANYSRDKMLPLRQTNLQLEKIRYQIRIAYKLRCLDTRRYEFCANAMLEIGRMVGGWIKSAGNEELIAGEWTPGEYHRFTVFEPKERPIVAAPYRDRVVHHALCNIIEPLFERGFMEESYACREGKGTHAALDRFVKQGLGRRGYLRYMDDFLVFGDCKRELAGIKDSIAGFLRERLQLELKANKSFVVPARSGLGFLGFRLFPCYRRLDGANVAKFVNRFRALRAGWHGGTVGFPEIKASLRAWVAHAEHGNTWNLRTELLAEVAL